MKEFFASLLITISLLGFSQSNVPFEKSSFSTEAEYQKAKSLLTKGDDYFYVGNFQKALPILLKTQKLNHNNDLLNFKIGVCYVKLKQADKALPYFKKSKTLNPKVDPKVDYALGIAFQANKEYEDAIDAYNNYLKSLSASKLKSEKSNVNTKLLECNNLINKGTSTKTVTVKNNRKTATATTTTLTDLSQPNNVQKIKKVKKTETPIKVTETRKRNTVSYKIQISSSSELVSKDKLKSIYAGPLQISHEKIGDLYKYYIGDFSSKKEAQKARKESGVDGAFLVAFKSGERL